MNEVKNPGPKNQVFQGKIKQEILLRKPKFQDQRSIRFCNSVTELFKKSCEIGQKLNSGHIKPDKTDAFERRLYSVLNSICLTKLADEKANIRLSSSKLYSLQMLTPLRLHFIMTRLDFKAPFL